MMFSNKKFVLILTCFVLAFNICIVFFAELMPTEAFLFRFLGMLDVPGIALYEFVKGDVPMGELSLANKLWKITVMTVGTTMAWVFVRLLTDSIRSRSKLS